MNPGRERDRDRGGAGNAARTIRDACIDTSRHRAIDFDSVPRFVVLQAALFEERLVVIDTAVHECPEADGEALSCVEIEMPVGGIRDADVTRSCSHALSG